VFSYELQSFIHVVDLYSEMVEAVGALLIDIVQNSELKISVR